MGIKTHYRKAGFLARFRREEDGVASIESLFWVPIFAIFLCMVLDVSLLFYGKAQALRAVQDGNRALSVHTSVTTPEAAEEFILANLAGIAPNAEVDTSVDGTTNIITTVAAIPASDLLSIGTFDYFDDVIITVSAQHYLE